ncbi:Restriction enzyme BgcI subunit alpha [Slackia heliotrinireducens]|uniref:HsdM family class I SAM-dependent methyltransferase n=1 Tax=Slackia heliotrinireducens TaxID=84110 RepID=UPI0001A3715E|nr:N-6 DNA methylase [Slackia heliotrinireducens]VEH01967.1 Restriction enzyme BgcI subunit alpha [Slackia heliotrinireducens]
MNRQQIVETIGAQYHRHNIEEDEWSYAKDAGTLGALTEKLGYRPAHYKLDRRFTDVDDTGSYAVLVETKQSFVDSDAEQLATYVEEEYALHRGTKVIAILANTNDDRIRVWKSEVDDEHLLPEETVLDCMEHYKRLFSIDHQNDREKVMRNTYALNELLHRKDIDEKNRSQFVGTCLLFVKHDIEMYCHGGRVNDKVKIQMQQRWGQFTPTQIRSAIGEVLEDLLDGSNNKQTKIRLLKRDVLEDQKVRALTQEDWIEVLTDILMNIYRYIDADSSEGQDILNLFFITFNKYVGKADKNQAFTPDHITDFMAQLTEVTWKDVVLDECCGSGSFLVQAMVKELADARLGCTEAEFRERADEIKQHHIFGIENEEKAYGLSTTNMLIHGDGNSNVEFGSCFDKRQFIADAKPTVILMNPPYNAKPRTIPASYKRDWTASERNGKSDPTKGLVFVKYLSDIAKAEDWDGVRLAVLLPMAAAIGTGTRLSSVKEMLLVDNTLEAVFSLPAEIFYPGASVQACCMLFTLNRSHYEADGCTPKKQTFFGYYRDDGFVKRKGLGRVEQFDADGHSEWKKILKKWLDLYRNKTIEAGYSAMQSVTSSNEWLAEAYMDTDYTKLAENDFQGTINNYLSYLVKTGVVYES